MCSENQDRQASDDRTLPDGVERFVRGRTKRYGRRLKAGYRLLPYYEELEDLIQEVHLYLIEIGPSILGPDYPQRIVDAIRVGSDLKAEVALRGAYLAAAGRLGDKQAKRFQRGQAQEQPLDHDVESRPSLPPETDILDDSIDLAHALTKLDDRELLVWTLSFKGHTLREIAELLSVSFQTVHRILVSVVKKLTAVLNTEA